MPMPMLLLLPPMLLLLPPMPPMLLVLVLVPLPVLLVTLVHRFGLSPRRSLKRLAASTDRGPLRPMPALLPRQWLCFEV